MLNPGAGEKGTSVLITGRRRRLGAWLLVGWLAYWFTTVAQACCIGFPSPGSVGRAPAFQAGELAVHSFSSPMLPSLPDIDCDGLSAIGPGATNTATADIERLHLPAADLLASERLATDSHDRILFASDPLHPPAFGVPLYLRNQRFLI